MTLHRLIGTGPASCALWQIDLDRPVAAAMVATLSPDERARADRFAFAHDRDRYIAAHVALRQILGEQLGVDGGALGFAAGPFGKPALVGLGAELHFNLSHSAGIALVALSTAGEIGVDVEVPRRLHDAEALAGAHFTEREAEALTALPAMERAAAFRVCWTRKEACLKALGAGFQLDAGSFEVGLAPVAQPVCIATAGGPARLMLHSFAVGAGAVGAVALRLPAQARATHPSPEVGAEAKAFAQAREAREGLAA